jgi:NADH-quinone oxidoreductase subunit E
MIADVDLDRADTVLSRIDSTEKLFNGNLKPSYLIPLLQEIQQDYGYLPRNVLEYVSKESGIPLSRMFGVITFYEQFYLQPQGRHTIKCCRGTACHVKEGNKVGEAISEILQIQEGETTADGLFTFETVACLGTCFLAPVMMIDDEYFGELTQQKVTKIINQFKEGKE